MQENRVLVAMSGGIDSSVAALLLQQKGYEVIGVTMQLWHESGGGKSCCSHTDITDARLVAGQLGIPHYVLDYEQEFKSTVVDYFAAEYHRGRTPNPCVMCNSKLKFNHLLQKADALGAGWIATGHYAGIEMDGAGAPALVRAVDRTKDQSYFLGSLKREYLPRIKFPLHTLTKSQVREIGRKYSLPNADKRESQDICFVGGKSYTAFLQKNYPTVPKRGFFKTATGEVLGEHQGVHRYTVGQRKGLGVAFSARRYVTAIDSDSGDITLGEHADLTQQEIFVNKVNWLGDRQVDRAATVVTRYHGEPAVCEIRPCSHSGEYVVRLDRRTLAAPGQAAVFYQDERVLGGGFICHARA